MVLQRQRLSAVMC